MWIEPETDRHWSMRIEKPGQPNKLQIHLAFDQDRKYYLCWFLIHISQEAQLLAANFGPWEVENIMNEWTNEWITHRKKIKTLFNFGEVCRLEFWKKLNYSHVIRETVNTLLQMNLSSDTPAFYELPVNLSLPLHGLKVHMHSGKC